MDVSEGGWQHRGGLNECIKRCKPGRAHEFTNEWVTITKSKRKKRRESRAEDRAKSSERRKKEKEV